MTSDTLLPCPFCQSGPEFLEIRRNHNSEWVECEICEAEGPASDKGGVGKHESAANLWNTRANTPSDPERVERVMRAISATAPNNNEGLVFSYGQVERGLRAAIAAMGTIADQDTGALSGSREPSPSCTGLGLSGFDPAREHAAFVAGWLTRNNCPEAQPEEAWLTYLDCLESKEP